ncbi:MAG: hypothetical protein M1827_006080 [Pycnora praestabilis]|nr:MAG: hypothetical protein M1827_006080 [Pycnora praestabilis]
MVVAAAGKPDSKAMSNGNARKSRSAKKLDTDTAKPFNDWPNDVGFEPRHEQREPVELTVTGQIPAYAAGILYRTGPGGHTVDTAKGTTISKDHWFDGFTQVHRFQILPSSSDAASLRVIYNSRTSVDGEIEKMRKTGSLEGFSFGQKRDPCQSYFKKVMSVFAAATTSDSQKPDEDNLGVTLSVNMPGLQDSRSNGHASGINSLYNKSDNSKFQKIDPETLEPIGLAKQQDLHPELKGPLSAAHAKSDPATRDIFNYNLEIGRKATYRIFKVSASTGKTSILATILDAPAAYLHSLLITENYVILCVWGSTYAMGGMRMLWEKNILDAIAPFDSSRKTKWYVIDRKNDKGVVATYESDPFFSFHTINAWEVPSATDPSKTDIIADLATYPNLDILKRFYYENMKSTSASSLNYVGEKGESSRGVLKRFRLPSVTGAASPLPSSSPSRAAILEWTSTRQAGAELPTMNSKYITKLYRYAYGVSDRGQSTFLDGLIKYDTHTHAPTYWQHHGQNPGEAIFIANPEGTQEDDGVLLSVVLDGLTGKSYLLCLDARNMQEMGRASLQNAVGFGFHGTHVPARQSGIGANV